VERFWRRLGAICAAAIAIITLAGLLQRFAMAEVNNRFDTIGEKIDRLTAVVNLAATAVSDPDSTERGDAVRRLRRMRQAIPEGGR
jgi:hypothetical protein